MLVGKLDVLTHNQELNADKALISSVIQGTVETYALLTEAQFYELQDLSDTIKALRGY